MTSEERIIKNWHKYSCYRPYGLLLEIKEFPTNSFINYTMSINYLFDFKNAKKGVSTGCEIKAYKLLIK